MRKEYDLTKIKFKPNPYAKKLKKALTIRIDSDVIDFFKTLAEKENIPYQTLINKFLRFCKDSNLKPVTSWEKKTNFKKAA
jgi:uncharacterized protein (DUF4415 family)